MFTHIIIATYLLYFKIHNFLHVYSISVNEMPDGSSIGNIFHHTYQGTSLIKVQEVMGYQYYVKNYANDDKIDIKLLPACYICKLKIRT